jgi:hypothetical protein
MTEPALDRGFPMARCAPCGRDVLTHILLGERGDEHRRCIHCDAEIDPEEVRWVVESELTARGYAVEGDRGPGCGKPDCGMGRCGG